MVLVRGQPLFWQAAMEKARTWQYEPMVVDGVAKQMVVIEPIGFFLGEDSAEQGWIRYATDERQLVEVRLWAVAGLRGLLPKKHEAILITLRTLANDTDERVAKAADSAIGDGTDSPK
jgi:hypothetical protein